MHSCGPAPLIAAVKLNLNQAFRKKRSEEGYNWEKKVFGFSSKNMPKPTHHHRRESILRVVNQGTYMGWNPRAPTTALGKEIFECVQSYLPHEMASQLSFYCSIGLSLDHYHGIDGFFKVGKCIVTVDLSITMKEKVKSNGIIHRKSDGPCLWRVCFKIAELLKQKVSNKEYW